MRFRLITFSFIIFASLVAAVPADSKPPVPEVVVIEPVVREITEYEIFNGYTDVSRKVELRAQATGELDKVLFKDGAEVKKGDVLFEVDPRLYQLELDKAEADLAIRELQSREADTLYQHAKTRFDNKSFSQEEFDKAKNVQAKAQMKVRVAKAGRDQAKLTLGFTKIVAPVSGRISRRLVEPGQVVKAAETHLATICSYDLMYVYFDIEEATFLRVRNAIRDGKVKTKGEWGLPVSARLGDEQGYSHEGRLDSVENRMDGEKRICRGLAVIPNSDGRLVPGLHARVRLTTSEPFKALMLPCTFTDPRRDYPKTVKTQLDLVNEKDVIERRWVEVGPRREDGFRVQDGLKQGDRVILDQGLTLSPGTVVKHRKEIPEDKEKE
jgi:membrane fusion protein, multidrug efflux system